MLQAFTNIIKTGIKSLLSISSKPPHTYPRNARMRIPIKVFGQAFFKKLVGCGAKPHGFDFISFDFYIF